MQLLQGISRGDVEFIASVGLNVRRGFPDGPLREADRYAFKGKSQPTGYSRMPPRMGGGLEFLGWWVRAVRVNSLREWLFDIL